MKILLIIAGRLSDSYGGGQVYIRNLLQGFSHEGMDCIVLAVSAGAVSGIEKSRYLNFPVYQITAEKREKEALVKQLLTKLAPDVIHAHGEKPLAIALARALKIPVIVTAHHGGILCPAGTLMNHRNEICATAVNDRDCLPCLCREIPGFRGWYRVLRRIPRNWRLNLSAWVDRRRFIPFLTPMLGLSGRIRQKEETVACLKRANRLISPCPAMAEAFARNGIRDNVEILPHAIPAFPPRPLPLPLNPVRFFYPGRISYVKGLHVMLEAFEGIPKGRYELHIIGEAANKKEIRYEKKLRRDYKDINVFWHEKISHDKIQDVIAGFHVMIHPALCLEIFGLTIAEAFSIGRPVVATRCGGAEVQIQEGHNGWLVPSNNASALRDVINRIIDAPELIQEYAKNCRTDGFSGYIQALQMIYRRVYSSGNAVHSEQPEG